MKLFNKLIFIVGATLIPICCCMALGKIKDQNLTESKAFSMLLDKANNSDTNAQYKLAVAYFMGRGSTISINNTDISNPLAKNYDKGTYWFKKATDLGDKMALFQLCSTYAGFNLFAKGKDSLGNVLKPYPDKAIQYCPKSKGGYDVLGDMFYKLENYSAAANYYKESIDNGNDWSQYKLAKMYFKGFGVEQNYTKAFNLVNQYVKKNIKSSNIKDGFYYKVPSDHDSIGAEPLYLLAQMYENGWGIGKNHSEALHYYFLATQVIDDSGKNVSKNLSAKKLVGFARQNDNQAIALLGSLGFLYGQCVPSYGIGGTYILANCPLPVNELKEKLVIAAKNGNALAQFVSGHASLYDWGKSFYTTQNVNIIDEANYWFLAAAKQGVLSAQISLCNNEFSALEPTKMYAWCKMVLYNKEKHPELYDSLTKYRSWAAYKYTQGMLKTMNHYPKITKKGEQTFNSYKKLYGDFVYELKQ